MKITQRILSALLIMVMVCALIPVSISADVIQFTPTNGTAADIAGIPDDATRLTYLSDAALTTKEYNAANGSNANAKNDAEWDGETIWFFHGSDAPGFNTVFNPNSGGVCYVPDANGTPVKADTVGKVNTKVYLGTEAIEYPKVLGVNAGKNADSYQVFLNNNSQYFYAVAGNNGANSTKGVDSITFEVWGSNDTSTFVRSTARENFTLLASTDVKGFQVAEFNVDISGYKVIWLNVKYNGTAGSGRYGAWGNACFYSLPAVEVDANPETNIRFGSALSLLTRWNKGAFAGVTGAQVTFKGEAVDATYTPDNTHYNVEYPGVAGKEMTEQVTVSLLNGQETVTTVTASVRDHALEYLATGSNAYYKTAMYHMLQFGAAAQNYFQYNTGAMANAGLADYASNAMTGEVSSEDVAERKVISGEAECFYGTNLRLEDRINLMFYFENLPAGATAQITVGDVTVTKTVKALENGLYMVEMDELAVADYKETVICTIYDGEAEVISVQDSVAGYAFRAQTKGGKLAAVCAELLKYAESVKVYLENK